MRKEPGALPLPLVDPPELGQLRLEQILEQMVMDLGWTPVAMDKYGSVLYEKVGITERKK